MPEPEAGAASLPSTEDILTPIHKAIRSMIYDVGARLQTTDFSDPAATDRILEDLRYEFGQGIPTACVVCLLHAHAGHEDIWAFPKLHAFDPMLVDELRQDHLEFELQLRRIQKMGAELRALPEAGARIRAGKRLALEVNDFFARYLAHMNREEAALVPLMNEHLTDLELNGIRDQVELSLGRERLLESLRWMFRSLNVNELLETFEALKADAPPELVAGMVELAASEVPAPRWAVVRHRVGL